MNKVMALDVGDRRIGIAKSDALGMTAQPVATYVRRGDEADWSHLDRLAAELGVRTMIVGLPRNMNGTIGPQAQNTHTFMCGLLNRGYEILWVDERLTTAAAQRSLIEGGLRREKRREVVDQVAAVHILSTYLQAPQRAQKWEDFMSIDDGNIVTILDEEDNEVQFEHIDTVLYEGREYVLLLPLDQPEDIGEDEEAVVILRIVRGEEEDSYENVEDEELLDAVFAQYIEMADEEGDFDD